MSANSALPLIVFSGGYDRVHYALVLASAAAAINYKVTLFFTGRALKALLAENAENKAATPGWHRLDPADDGAPAADRDASLRAGGVAGFEELLLACRDLGVSFMVCEMAVRALDLPSPPLWRSDLPVQAVGVVTFLQHTTGGAPLFI